MSTDYDAPRRTETDDVSEESREDLTARRSKAQLAVVDVDESESAESFELPARKTVALPSFWSRCCHLEESCDTLVTPSESSNTLATQSQQGLCS
jgi:Domain of unknown function (DUF4193)